CVNFRWEGANILVSVSHNAKGMPGGGLPGPSG
ncbi:unnamed protein product, partial [marine sediment metagenome]